MAGRGTNFLLCIWATQMLKKLCTQLSLEKDYKRVEKGITPVLTL